MDDIIILAFIGAILAVLIYIFWKRMKRLLINSLVGIILLLVLQYVFMIDIPINMFTLLVAALFGIPGVGTLLILHLGGMLC
ncbi:MAG: pro-sigmaK processing inhibitor BofA family protein [Candidatus Altiarchaeales archaeon]|nr:pro-sigmaK processing inhibitor BofA family protein [Candidatus Altiarchaeota archaeon]MCG2782170.1 pro-sigmaK processing inhibitor BofA family protein [Candidatus Altiarchaeales archaeon]MBU4266635.1 pro-sigmaK processing inhibitor BofA family protein [Candidatus Altiarchaeota archaeon]MBU4341121.1 pro-sigmaK processing inhibitor BofA family protein [Candidatus Altiarchaeota archaeon]MBU4406867.1 pro-sigmaK processing inhibitor BofA family protein [Candidatus Altiarchaeota archaeon]